MTFVTGVSSISKKVKALNNYKGSELKTIIYQKKNDRGSSVPVDAAQITFKIGEDNYYSFITPPHLYITEQALKDFAAEKLEEFDDIIEEDGGRTASGESLNEYLEDNQIEDLGSAVTEITFNMIWVK